MSINENQIDLSADNLQTTEQKMLAEMRKQTRLLQVLVGSAHARTIETFEAPPVNTKGKPKK